MIIYNQIKACLLNLKKGGIPMQQKCGMLINNVNNVKRWFAALLMELCLCGERIASIMGIRNWYDQVGTVRIFLCILIFCYYYIIKKPRLLDTPEWYELMKKDRVIYGMWILEMIILVSSIGT